MRQLVVAIGEELVNVNNVLEDLRDLADHASPAPAEKTVGSSGDLAKAVMTMKAAYEDLRTDGTNAGSVYLHEVVKDFERLEKLIPVAIGDVKTELPISMDKATVILMSAAQDWAHGHMSSKEFKDVLADVLSAFVQPTTPEGGA